MPRETTESIEMEYDGIIFRRYPNSDRSSRAYWQKHFTQDKIDITLYLHRYVWEQENGEIPDGYCIHHKDGNTLNNDIENLELLESGKHTQQHMLEHWQDPEYKKKGLKQLSKNRLLAREARLDPECIEKQRQSLIEYWKNPKKVEVICTICEKKFSSPRKTTKFCSEKCYSKCRRDTGKIHKVSICVYCKRKYPGKKYEKQTYCSRNCANKARSKK